MQDTTSLGFLGLTRSRLRDLMVRKGLFKLVLTSFLLVLTNIVQSIRAFRVQDLQDAAAGLGQHFLYANLAHAQSKQDVLDLIAAAVHLSVALRQEFRCALRQHDRSGAQIRAAAGLHRGAGADSGQRASSTRKRASSCSISSAMPQITGATARFRSAVSILFCSPFCTHQPSRTGERG
jgi:hypothetical protein